MNAATTRAKIRGEGPSTWVVTSLNTMVKRSNLIKQDYYNKKLEGNVSRPMVTENRELLCMMQKEQNQCLTALEDTTNDQVRQIKKLRLEQSKINDKMDILIQQNFSRDALLRAFMAARQPGMATMPPVMELSLGALPTGAAPLGTASASMLTNVNISLNVSQSDTHETANAADANAALVPDALQEIMTSGGKPFK